MSRQMSAVKIMSEGGLPMLLDMLRVRDYGVQHSCIQVLLHLIRHNGEVSEHLLATCSNPLEIS